MAEMPVVIFHHIVKTAGTSLRHTTRKNYAPDGLFEPDDLPEPPRVSLLNWYHSRSPSERQRLECVIGHYAHLLVPPLLYDGATVRLFTMLRDPVERCASYYSYSLERAAQEPTSGMGRVGRFLLDRGLSLADVYRQFGDGSPRSSDAHLLLGEFFDGQVRSILWPLILPTFSFRPTADERIALQIAKNILERRYTVGVTEEYEKSLALFAETFGWSARESVRLNVTSSRRDAPPLPAETVELIRAHNPLDLELHAEYLARFR